MAMGAGGGVNGRNSGRNGGRRPMSEINVTPLVDVMLVLLIVFMVTAPLLAVGVKVDLPQSRARPLGEDVKPLSVSLDSKGSIFLQETEIPLEQLVARLQAIAENSTDTRIYVRADKNLPYGVVMDVMGRISAGGFNKVALITEPPVKKK